MNFPVFSVSELAPVDFRLPGVEASWQETVRSSANPRLAAILEVRSAVQDLIVSCLRRRGFVHPPVYVLSGCVDPLNHATEPAPVGYFGQECSLVQSLIFHKMALLALSSLDSVFWISPNVRKEGPSSEPQRYATEFTQVDFESASLDMEGAMALIEGIVKETVNTLSETHGDVIEALSGRRLEPLSGALAVFDAEVEARRRGLAVQEVERALVREIREPCFLVNLKREAYDRRDDARGVYRNYDVLMPVTGEILSGGEREFEAERLEARMRELNYPLAYFAPILRVAREYGLRPSAGAGFGIERIVRGLCLLEDIAEVYPFPRRPGQPIVF